MPNHYNNWTALWNGPRRWMYRDQAHEHLNIPRPGAAPHINFIKYFIVTLLFCHLSRLVPSQNDPLFGKQLLILCQSCEVLFKLLLTLSLLSMTVLLASCLPLSCFKHLIKLIQITSHRYVPNRVNNTSLISPFIRTHRQ